MSVLIYILFFLMLTLYLTTAICHPLTGEDYYKIILELQAWPDAITL